MRRFYAPTENFSHKEIVLTLEETRHLRDVLRLRRGEKVRVFDGGGREFLCSIEQISKQQTLLEIIEEIAPAAPESDLDLTLAVAFLKGEKFDLVIQKAVELGVTRFCPLITKRSDVKLKDTGKKIERWQKITLEACKQSGRAKLMQIETPAEFEKFIKGSAFRRSENESLLLLSERSGAQFSAVQASKKITAVIGPEGGWENTEIEFAKSNACQVVTLGGRILRAETAAISIAAVLQHRFGDFH